MSVSYLFTPVSVATEMSLSECLAWHIRHHVRRGWKVVEHVLPTGYSINESAFVQVLQPETVKSEVLIDSHLVNKCDSKPSFQKAKRLGSIVMNPYSNESIFAERTFGTMNIEVGTIVVTNHRVPIPIFGFNRGKIRAVPANGVPGEIITDLVWSCTAIVSLAVPYNKQVDLPKENTLPDVPDVSNLKTRVYTQLMADVSSADFDLSTNLAEAKETATMFKNMIPQLFDSYRNLRKAYVNVPKEAFKRGLSKRRFKKMLKELPDEATSYWLLYRYGIMPAKYAVDDLQKAISRENPVFETIRAGDSEKLDLPQGWTGKAQAKAHAVWKGKFSSSSPKRTSMWLPTTAYELVPFSFVADWFVNVGDLLQQLRPVPTVYSNSCISCKIEIDSKKTHKIELQPGVYNVSLTANAKNLGPAFSATTGNITLNGVATIPSLFQKEVPVSVYKAEIFSRGSGNVGFALNTDLTWKQTLDAISLTWQMGLSGKLK